MLVSALSVNVSRLRTEIHEAATRDRLHHLPNQKPFTSWDRYSCSKDGMTATSRPLHTKSRMSLGSPHELLIDPVGEHDGDLMILADRFRSL